MKAWAPEENPSEVTVVVKIVKERKMVAT